MLTFPNRNRYLDLIDESFAGLERLPPMWCCDRRIERDVANLQRTDPMGCGNVQPRLGGNSRATFCEHPLRVWVGLIVERADAPPVIVVSDDAGEYDQRTIGG